MKKVGRILTLQRQARELGRLRAGIYIPPADGKRGRPARSQYWILTSHQRAYLDVAAELWGGQVEEWEPQGSKDRAWRLITEAASVDAILPPGEGSLSQSYEMWSKGGCQRRCDGETEHLSQKPCPCRVEFGEEFWNNPDAVDARGNPLACKPHTRLNVILPDLPDLGVWRVETKGFYSANEIPAAVDLIMHATGGDLAVPIRLRIEPRKRVAQGKTKQFPVIVVEIRGATAGQILSGQPAMVAVTDGGARQAITDGSEKPALPAGGQAVNGRTPEQYISLAKLAQSPEQVKQLGKAAEAAGVATDDVKAAMNARWRELQRKAEEAAASAPDADSVEPDPVVEGDIEPDANAVWAQIQAHVGQHYDWNADGLEQRVIGFLGKSSIDANGFQLEKFLAALKGGEIR